jgi:antitoxin component YwqK of YwqJK toxin-antitoxin module
MKIIALFFALIPYGLFGQDYSKELINLDSIKIALTVCDGAKIAIEIEPQNPLSNTKRIYSVESNQIQLRYLTYHRNGILQYDGNFKLGNIQGNLVWLANGTIDVYNTEGILVRTELYNSGLLINE